MDVAAHPRIMPLTKSPSAIASAASDMSWSVLRAFIGPNSFFARAGAYLR